MSIRPGSSQDILKIESTIAKKTNGAFIYAVLSIFGFVAIVACPLAFIYAGQALRLIDQYHVGERFRGSAKTARVLATVVFLFYATIAIAFISFALMGGK